MSLVFSKDVRVSLRTLGGLGLVTTAFARPKPLLLLAYLSLEGPKDKRFLAELFFPESEDKSSSLRQTMSRLRQAGTGLVESDTQRLWTPLLSDAAAFLTALEARELERAATLYHGPFLTGAQLPDLGVELEEWVYATREFLAGALRGTLLTLAEEASGLGELQTATRYAEQAYHLEGAAELEPEAFEPLYTLLASGNSPHAAVLKREAESYGVALKPFKRGLLDEPKSPEVKAAPALPSRAGAFVGRAAEKAELEGLLARPEVRLLTLLGPGGVGKTRLALELASAEQVKGEVTFIPLEPLTALAQLPQAIAGALGLTLQDEGEALTQIINAIGDSAWLLILDNFEHLVSDTSALSHLLGECPNLKLLVTTRERLNLEAEWAFPLEGLGLPPQGASVEHALEFPAVQLFIQRAKRARLSFELTPEALTFVHKICDWVEGSPLGLELAAGWVKLLSVEEIAEELSQSLDFLSATVRDTSARHGSVRAVFESSWSRLSESERAVLRKLSVFRGGFTRQAAAAVTGATLPVLANLVDKSLLRLSERGRYDRHMLVYGYSQEKLAAQVAEETATREKHAAYFLELVETAAPLLKTNQQKVWLERLEIELDNLHAAYQCLSVSTPHFAFGLFNALSKFFIARGRVREGTAWADELLELDIEYSDEQANFFNCAGAVFRARGDYKKARTLYERSLEVWQRLSDTESETRAFGNLAVLAFLTGDYGAAQQRYETVLERFRATNDTLGLSKVLHNLGALHAEQGQFEQGAAYFQESLVLSRDNDYKDSASCSLQGLGIIAYERRDYETALQHTQESLALTREVGDKRFMAGALETLGRIAYALGDIERAHIYLREGLEVQHSIDDKAGMMGTLEAIASLVKESHLVRAVNLWSAAERFRQELSVARPPRERERYAHELASAKATLGEKAFSATWEHGQRLGFKQAFELGLDRSTV